MVPVKVCEIPKTMPTRGVYLMSEGMEHLYAGRSNRLRARMRDHGGSSSAQTKSAFAFRLARESTGRTKPSYKPEGSSKALMKDPMFLAEFVRAKERIGQMDVRFVEECDPERQALFEMYVAIALQTPYNAFDNH